MSTQIARPIVENIPQVRKADDAGLIRFGFMACHPINLSTFTGSKYLGTWPNDKIPSKTLLMITEANNLGPYEYPAQIQASGGSFEIDPGMGWASGMSRTALEGGEKAGPLTPFRKSPKMVAYTLMRQYEARGMCLFEKMAGFDEGYVHDIFSYVLPDKVMRGKREVLNVTVKGPFLDQIIEHLGTWRQSGKVVHPEIPAAWSKLKVADQEERVKFSKYMFRELWAACQRAWHFENNHLNESESDIKLFRAGKRGKQDYGRPNENYATEADPQLPLDLIALADTNRTPLDLQEVAAANAVSVNTKEAMIEGMKLISAELADKLSSPAISEDAIAKIVAIEMAKRDEHWKSQIAELVEVELAKARQQEPSAA